MTMFDVLKRSVHSLWLGIDEPTSRLLYATYDDATPTSDSLMDENISLLLGRNRHLDQSEACGIISGRLTDEPTDAVFLKVLMLFRALIVSQYSSSNDINLVFGDRSIFKLFESAKDVTVRVYRGVVERWVGVATTQTKFLHKDSLVQIIGPIWADPVFSPGAVKSISNSQIMDGLYDLFVLAKVLLECHLSFNSTDTRWANQDQRGLAVKRTASATVIPRLEFPALLLQHCLETVIDVQRVLICASGLLQELSERSAYRFSSNEEFEDFTEFCQEYQTCYFGMVELLDFLDINEDKLFQDRLMIGDKSTLCELPTTVVDAFVFCNSKLSAKNTNKK
eukprot:GHVH01001646.1.p1 GENE.GHVH01001646.1~~GHVH01001646.1.p1  ORF type:complete len:337 (+),score=43.57 GHVH01001646.1:54-1064(+)